MSSTTQEVIALEKRLWTDMHDKEFFESALADDVVSVIEPMGFVTKQQAVSADAKPWHDVRITDVKATEVTPDVVTIAYHGQGMQEGRDKPYMASIASTWVKKDGRWQLALTAHQPWQPAAEKAA